MATNAEVEITLEEYSEPEEGVYIEEDLDLLLYELLEGYFVNDAGVKVVINQYEQPEDFLVDENGDVVEQLVYAITSLVPTSKWLLRCLSFVRGTSRCVALACLMGYLAIPEDKAQNFFENPQLSPCDLEMLFIVIAYGMTSPGACISNKHNEEKFNFAISTYIEGGLAKTIQKCAMSKVMIAKTVSNWVFSTPVGMEVRKALTAAPGRLPPAKKRKLEGIASSQQTLPFSADPNSWKDRMESNIEKAKMSTTVALSQFTGGSNEELTVLIQRWINIGLLKSKNAYGAFFAGTNVYGGDVFPKEDQESFSATFQRLWCVAQCTTQQQFPIVIGQFILMGGNIGDRLATGIGSYNVSPAVNTAMANDDTGRELQEFMKKIKLPPGMSLPDCAKSARVTARAQGKSDCGLVDSFN